MIFFGYLLVLLNGVDAISALTECHPVKNQLHCFYTDGSVLSWDDAREFCKGMNSTLPIITHKNIDNVFQQFMSDTKDVAVNGSNTEQMSNYVWLDAHAQRVNNSVKWHWINGPTSALKFGYNFYPYDIYGGPCASIGIHGDYYVLQPRIFATLWSHKLPYICQYHSITQVDGKCTSKWEGPYNYVNQVSVLHSSATTLAKCKKACEFDPRCTAVDWLPGGSKCWLKVNGMYRGLWPWLFNEVVQYKLSRCNVTPDGADVVYNKFNAKSDVAPVNPPKYTNSDYNCVVATNSYWRLSRCNDRHRVICQSVDSLPRTTAIDISTSESSQSAGNTGNTAAVVVGVVVARYTLAIVVVVVFVVFVRRRRRRRIQPKHQTVELSTTQTASCDEGEPKSSHWASTVSAVAVVLVAVVVAAIVAVAVIFILRNRAIDVMQALQVTTLTPLEYDIPVTR